MLDSSGLSFIKVSLPSVVLFFIFTFQYLGLPILYFKFDDYRAGFVTDSFLVLEVFLYTSITITLMIGGFILARKVLDSVNIHDVYSGFSLKNAPTINFSYFRLNTGLIIFGLFGVIVLLFYLSKVGNIALFEIREESIAQARSEMTNGFSGKYHWYKLVMIDAVLFLSLSAYASSLINKKLLPKIIFLLLFAIVVFTSIMSAQKALLLFSLMSFFLVYIIVKKESVIPLSQCLFFLIFLFVLAAVTNYLFSGSYPDSTFLRKSVPEVVSRVLTGEIQPAYHYLQYSQTHDYLMGRSFPNPGGIFNFTSINLPESIMNMAFPNDLNSNVIGSMPTIFWGEMYVNFGFYGIIVPPLFVGFFLYLIDKSIYCFHQTSLTIGFYVWLSMHYKNLSMSGLSSFIIDFYLFFIALLFLTLYFFTYIKSPNEK